jgi:cell filamentation protein
MKEANWLVSSPVETVGTNGKRRLTDTLDAPGVSSLAKSMPNHEAAAFLDWLTYSDKTIDGQSKEEGLHPV